MCIHGRQLFIITTWNGIKLLEMTIYIFILCEKMVMTHEECKCQNTESTLQNHMYKSFFFQSETSVVAI